MYYILVLLEKENINCITITICLHAGTKQAHALYVKQISVTLSALNVTWILVSEHATKLPKPSKKQH